MAKANNPKKKAAKKAAAKPSKAVKSSGQGKGAASPKKAAKKPVKKPEKSKPKKSSKEGIVGRVRGSEKKPRRRKVEPLVYRGAAISEALEYRIRQLREKYRKAGRMVSFEYILDWYFQTEDEFCANKDKPYESYSVWKSEFPFSYEYVDLVSEGTVYDELENRSVIERLEEFVAERGDKNARIYIKGLGDTKARRYGRNVALEKLNDELNLILTRWKEYWDEQERLQNRKVSPDPVIIPLCENRGTGVIMIDLDNFIAQGIDPADRIYNEALTDKESRYRPKKYAEENYSGWGQSPAKVYPKDPTIKKRMKKEKVKKVKKAAKKAAKKAPAKPKKAVKKAVVRKIKPVAAPAKKGPGRPPKAVAKASAKKVVAKKAVGRPKAQTAAELLKQLKKMGYDVSGIKKAPAKPAKAVKKAVVRKIKPVAAPSKRGPGRPPKEVKRGPGRPPKAPAKKPIKKSPPKKK